MKTFLVIPAYNEERRLKNLLKKLAEYKLPTIVVDDGSTDKTLQVLSEINNQKSKIKILRHKVNLGKGAAMKTGAEAAIILGADSIIFMDADGQHDPSDLPKFLTKLKSRKFDIIFGIRENAHDVPVIRGFGNKVGIVLVFFLFGIRVSDLLCGYRAITKSAFKKMSWESTRYGIETEMVARTASLGLKHTKVVVKTIYHDKVKGVTILDAFGILFDLFRWRLSL